MKIRRSVLALWLMLLLPTVGLADAPHELAGFVLGDPFSPFRDLVDMQTKMPLRHSKSIDAIEVRPQAGYKYGIVWVATCTEPNRIVSIRMKYADASKKFYDELLRRFKQRFGEPSEWRGDPFHIVISWKWSFVDDQNNRISLILEHNKRDEDETVGNTVKMTMWNLVEEERECALRRAPAQTETPSKTKEEPLNWDLLVPR